MACILCCRFLIWTHQTFKSPPRLQTKSFSLNLASRGYLGIYAIKTKTPAGAGVFSLIVVRLFCVFFFRNCYCNR
ncbi:hypothetical protein BTO00_05735 [Vibrio campbellii]|nr:hypothetical protein BTO00_05735 [Vibrio campbellii]